MARDDQEFSIDQQRAARMAVLTPEEQEAANKMEEENSLYSRRSLDDLRDGYRPKPDAERRREIEQIRMQCLSMVLDAIKGGPTPGEGDIGRMAKEAVDFVLGTPVDEPPATD